MDLEALQQIDSMTWLIIGAAVIITIAVLFNKAVKSLLKIAVIVVVLAFVLYFLVQNGVLAPPTR